MVEKELPPSRQGEDAKGTRCRSGLLCKLSYPFRQAWRAVQYVDGAYLRGHPELELFPTVQQRRRATRRVVSRFVWRRAFWFAVARTMVFAVLLGLIALALLAALRTWYPFPIRPLLPWAVVPMLLVVIIAVSYANRWMSRCVPELLRHELLDHGVPICVACGYPLFELPGPKCPECGTPFDKRAREILDIDSAPAETEETTCRPEAP